MANITFDDLIPKEGQGDGLAMSVKAKRTADGGTALAPASPALSFDDLIPKVTRGDALRAGVVQGATFGMGDEVSAAAMAAPGMIGQAEATKRALDQKMKEEYGINLPSIPSPLAAITGGARLLAEKIAPGYFGRGGTQAYDKDVAASRAEVKAASEQFPMTYIGGNLAGGLAVPLGSINSARQGAKVGAAAGAAYGFGSGEGLADSAWDATKGAAFGGVLGGALGKLMPAPGAPAQASPVVQASERTGISVPVAVASESQTVQRAGQGVKVVPFAGERMAKAVARTQDEATAALDNIASGLGSKDIETAGSAAVGSIRDWVTGKSRDALKTAYDDVDRFVNPNVQTTLSKTQGEVANILAERQAQRINDPGKAVNFVLEAAQDAQGLTYEGIKGLRTRVGEMLDNPSMLPAETSKAELRRIYGALTDDLSNAVERAGGAQAKVAWERANTLNKAVAQRREELAKIVGEGADAAPEKVFARLQTMASNASSANINLLAKARSTIGAEWDEVSSAIIANMGRDASGTFTPDRFVTAYAKLSDAGKGILFDKTTRQALDDINTISTRMQTAFKRYGNASGTAQNVGLAGAGYGLAATPVATIASLIGGNAMALILARPASASSMAKWARAYEVALRKPTAGTLATLSVASRNFASNIAEKAGVNVTGEQIMRSLSGMNPSRADTQQENAN